MADHRTVSRRAFLARIGVLGVAVGSGALAVPAVAGASPSGAGLAGLPGSPGLPEAAALRRVLADLTRDAFAGLAVFVVPGRDRYSRAQGTPRLDPGAIEAGAHEILVDAFDHVVPFPDAMARPVAAGFQAALSDPAVELPEHLVGLPPAAVDQVDAALRELLTAPQGDGVPLSLAIALLLNLLATQVDPQSIDGGFRAPFARLSFTDKARVFALVEGPEPELIAALDTDLPEPLVGSLVGVLRTFGPPMLELPALITYSEAHVFDPASRRLTSQPLGWRLTGYRGARDGWDDFRGYYQGRTEVSDA
jgi:hypothetical protein